MRATVTIEVDVKEYVDSLNLPIPDSEIHIENELINILESEFGEVHHINVDID